MRRQDLRERSIALLLTLSIHLLLALILLTIWTRPAPPIAVETLSAFDIAVPPPDTVIEPKPAQPQQRPQPSSTSAAPISPLPIPLLPALPGPEPLPAAAPVAPLPPARPSSASPPVPPQPSRPAETTKADWEALVLARIEQAKRYPRVIGSRRPTGTATVEFRVSRSGALIAAKVVRSSGNAALDRAAVEAVSHAAPYPPIPDDHASELTLRVPVIFLRSN